MADEASPIQLIMDANPGISRDEAAAAYIQHKAANSNEPMRIPRMDVMPPANRPPLPAGDMAGLLAAGASNFLIPGSGILPALARVGLAGGASYLGSRVAGEEHEKAMDTGARNAAGSALGETVAGGTGALWNYLKSFNVVRQGIKDAGDFFAALRKEVPAFPALHPDPESLMKLRDPAIGKDALKKVYAASDKQIQDEFGNEIIKVPSMIPMNTERYGRLAGKQIQEPMDIAKLQQKVKDLKAKARDTFDPQNPAANYNIQQEADSLEGFYRDTIGNRNPRLRDAYDAATVNFGKGLSALDILNKSGAIAHTPDGAYLDMPKLQQFLYKNYQNYPESRFPELWKMVKRGGTLGAADVTKGALPMVRGEGVRTPGSRVYLNLPQRQILANPAQAAGSPAVRAGASALGQRLLSNPTEEQQ